MATPKKTQLSIVDHDNGIVQKLWIVGREPEANVDMYYIGHGNDPEKHNEELRCAVDAPPKYFTDFAEARNCAKFWNETVFWPYSKQYGPRHGFARAFKPHLVKVVMA